MTGLILQRANRANLEDYDVLEDGTVIAASSCRRPRRSTARGSGQPTTTKDVRRPMAMSRRARKRWLRSPVGVG